MYYERKWYVLLNIDETKENHLERNGHMEFRVYFFSGFSISGTRLVSEICWVDMYWSVPVYWHMVCLGMSTGTQVICISVANWTSSYYPYHTDSGGTTNIDSLNIPPPFCFVSLVGFHLHGSESYKYHLDKLHNLYAIFIICGFCNA